MKNLVANEQLTLDSRDVAEMVGKPHNDLIKSIRNSAEYLVEGNFSLNEFFIKSSYKDSIGRTLPCYLITRKGCEFIAHKMTGRKGSLFTAEYINRFHEMENRLNKPAPKPEPPQIIPKYYRGIPVLTLQDITDLSGVSRSTVRYYLKKFVLGTDYLILSDVSLARLKHENPCLNKAMNSITVVTASGYKKLRQYLQLPRRVDSPQQKELLDDKFEKMTPQNRRLVESWFKLTEIQRAEALGYMTRMMA